MQVLRGARNLWQVAMTALSPNPAQEAAANALSGAVLIGAGAGSGKTRTLAERFARALSDDDAQGWAAASVDDILTITFTDKAAGELAERIRATLRMGGRRTEARKVDSAWISTIHGFCSRVLRRFAIEAGLDPMFSVPDPVESGRMRERAFEIASTTMLESVDGEALFGAFEYGAVFDATVRISRELRARGMGADSIALAPVRPAEDVRSEAVSLFASAGDLIRACANTADTTLALIDECAAAADRLGTLDIAGLSNDDAGRAVWDSLAMWKSPARSQKVKEVQASLKEAHARLMADVAECVAEPLARAMRGIVTEYLAAYSALKAERGMLDFDDLQIETRRLLRSSPEVLAQCRAMFRMVMVDEFQDTDALQAEIFSAVAGENLCTVGDECQSIYRFRGADIEVYRSHNGAMLEMGAQRFALAKNYRSHPDVLRFINGVFGDPALLEGAVTELEHGRAESEPSLVPAEEPRVDVAIVEASDGPDAVLRRLEAVAVASRLAHLRDACGVDSGDMAVLVRNYLHAHEYTAALRRAGFEAVVVGGSRFFGLVEVNVMRSLSRVIANPHDEAALMQLMTSDLGRVSDDGLLLIAESVRTGGKRCPVWEVVQEPPEELGKLDSKRVSAVGEAVEAARHAVGEIPLSDILLRVTEACGYDLVLLGRGDEGRQAYANVLKFARLAATYEESSVGAGPAGFVRYLDGKELYKDHTSPAALADDGTRAVRIMSIHAAKGLEFPVVAVVGLGPANHSDRDFVRVAAASDGEMLLSVRMAESAGKCVNRPAAFAQMDEAARIAEREEAKRAFYVACTRAEDVLILSGNAHMDRKPDEAAESPLGWLRLARPDLRAEKGGGPLVVDDGDLRVRVEVLACDGDAAPAEIPDAAARREPDPGRPVSWHDEAEQTTAPDQLSYSDLALYERCGQRFWAERLLRVGHLDLGSPRDPMRLGNAVHAALQLAVDGQVPPEARLTALARTYELDSAGASQLVRAVQVFVRSRAAQRLLASSLVRREWGFAVRLHGEAGDVDLVGSMDAYGRDGVRGLIVDYKTGTSGEEQELSARYELQARCYALAAMRDGCESVEVLFVRPECEDSAGEPQTVEFEFKLPDVPGIEEEILSVHARMARGEYLPLERWSRETCGGCAIAGGVCALTPGNAG